MQINLINNFVSDSDLILFNHYFDVVNDADIWPSSLLDYWDKRTYDISNIIDDFNDRKSYARFMNILSLIGLELKKQFNIDKKIYADSLQLMRLSDGEDQKLHADNADLIRGGGGVAPWRQYASLIYLNDNFSGGQTFFENFGIEIQPSEGDLLMFSCDAEHAHGVRPVSGATRRTLISFWGYENVNKKYRVSI